MTAVKAEMKAMIKGEVYTEARRGDAAKGDFVRIDENITFLTRGAFYEITNIDYANDPHIKDNDGDDYDLGGDSYTVFKKDSSAHRPTVGDYIKVIVSATRENGAKRGEILRIVRDDVDGRPYKAKRITGETVPGFLRESHVRMATKEEVATEGRLKAGEYGKIVGKEVTRQDRGSHNFEIGQIVKIDIAHNSCYRCVGTGDSQRSSVVSDADIVKATPAEVEAATGPKFNNGDLVRITRIEGPYLDGFSQGEIVKVTRNTPDHDGDIHIERINGCHRIGCGKPGIFEKVSPEEAEKFAKWTAIGRKVDEYKAGDIIRIKTDQGGDKAGTVVQIKALVRSGEIEYHSTKSANGSYLASKDFIELVAPVNTLFNN